MLSDEDNDYVSAEDSVSQVAAAEPHGSVASAGSNRSATSAASSSRRREAAGRAALLAKAATLDKRLELEMEEAQLKAKRERLELKTALFEYDAKMRVLQRQDCERQRHATESAAIESSSAYMSSAHFHDLGHSSRWQPARDSAAKEPSILHCPDSVYTSQRQPESPVNEPSSQHFRNSECNEVREHSASTDYCELPPRLQAAHLCAPISVKPTMASTQNECPILDNERLGQSFDTAHHQMPTPHWAADTGMPMSANPQMTSTPKKRSTHDNEQPWQGHDAVRRQTQRQAGRPSAPASMNQQLTSKP